VENETTSQALRRCLARSCRWLVLLTACFSVKKFDLARALIEARTAAGLSQAQLARRMKTSQSHIARIEGGKVRPSTDALERFSNGRRRVDVQRVVLRRYQDG